MPLTDDQLAGWFKREGFQRPDLIVKALKEANVQPETAAALLSMETGDGSNVWGHDQDNRGCIPPCGGEVTESNYKAYKARRLKDGRMQGCGPTQLTWHAYQDEADKAGGCWKPYPNMLTGFRVLRRQYDANQRNLWAAFKLYNGSGDYATRAVQKRQEFVRKLNAYIPPQETPLTPRQRTRRRMRRARRGFLKTRANAALRVYLISKARLGLWDKRYCAYYGVDANVDAGVRRFITRGYAAGLVATSTTGGTHAPGSWHFQKLGGKGRAADMGVRREHVGAPEQGKRLNAFHAAEWKRRGRTHPIELIGPANNLIVLKGSDTALAEGTALEQAHDNHVHGAF